MNVKLISSFDVVNICARLLGGEEDVDFVKINRKTYFDRDLLLEQLNDVAFDSDIPTGSGGEGDLEKPSPSGQVSEVASHDSDRERRCGEAKRVLEAQASASKAKREAYRRGRSSGRRLNRGKA